MKAMIETWRASERSSPTPEKTGEQVFSVLPSGRQAITQALTYFGLGRTSRVALPEFSSHCVISSVATIATPLPMREVINHALKPDCILIYEQWGWPSQTKALKELLQSGTKLILDCVDSPDAFSRHADIRDHPNIIVIVSLSKCLGLQAGGLISKQAMAELPEPDGLDQELLGIGSHHYKTYGRSLHPITPWLAQNSITAALSEEAKARSDNLRLLANSSLADEWSTCMKTRARNDCTAGIAPLFRGFDANRLSTISRELATKHGVVAPVYNFDWNANPLAPSYSSCLAFPCHGEVDVTKFLPILERYGTTQ